MNQTPWEITGPDVASVRAKHPFPLQALAEGATPAIVLRAAVPPARCKAMVGSLIERNLLFDPRQPTPPEFEAKTIPEGYFRDGIHESSTGRPSAGVEKRRIDVGSSLGYRGSDRSAFFQHCSETNALFASLFPDFDPISICYGALAELSDGKRVTTAYEPDGSLYGPAIIRAHYGGYTYAPHFDSVRLREKRDEYAVHAFEHQFAGVLVLQNSELADMSAQCVIHRCFWNEDVDEPLRTGRFHQYAKDRQIESVRVVLDPGDLYFFNTRAIHEVPGVAGDAARIVLAMFIGYSEDRDEIFVWS